MPRPRSGAVDDTLFAVCVAVVASSFIVRNAILADQLLVDEPLCQQSRTFAPPFDWHTFLENMSDKDCHEYFRMDKAALHDLHDRIGHHLRTARPDMGVRACHHDISSMQRLMVAVRYFAGALPPDLKRVFFPISKCEIFNSIHMVIDAINLEMAHDWNFPMPPINATAEQKVRPFLHMLLMCWPHP